MNIFLLVAALTISPEARQFSSWQGYCMGAEFRIFVSKQSAARYLHFALIDEYGEFSTSTFELSPKWILSLTRRIAIREGETIRVEAGLFSADGVLLEHKHSTLICN